MTPSVKGGPGKEAESAESRSSSRTRENPEMDAPGARRWNSRMGASPPSLIMNLPAADNAHLLVSDEDQH